MIFRALDIGSTPGPAGFPLMLGNVSFIALIYLGIEIVRAYSVYGFGDVSDVAHIAHIGGFFAAYAVSPTIARNAPVPPDVDVELVWIPRRPLLVNPLQNLVL